MSTHPFSLHWGRLAILTTLLFCLSCSGPKYNPVHGKVLYKNEPLGGVIVTFHLTGNRKLVESPHGITAEDGTFDIKTGEGVGAPEGEYAVTFYSGIDRVDKSGKAVKPKGMTMQQEIEDRFKGAYSEPSRSNIKVSIKSGKNELEPFNLK